ncbi:hypothetical protein HPB58_13005 [Priestia filamentosa]|uniref:glycosyltransferase n=1 Tax=Priestia filamentosa TaxID=1402861 RepID=UPI001FB52FCE|nr:hypothetical protein [Priestia filamentosa]UOE58276.1 hypothetical protein HPB58_13005 [Priestia filamentosa]
MRVLFLATNYSIGSNMSGIGLRIWELSQVLSAHFEVTILSNNFIDITHPGITCRLFDENTWKGEINKADTIICYDLPDPRLLLYANSINKQIITENAIPLEHLDYHSIKNSNNPNDYYRNILTNFKLQLLLSDFFITRARIEETTLISALALLDRVNYSTYTKNNQLSSMITYIPIGFNLFSDKHKEQCHTYSKSADFIWNGGIWDYYQTNILPETIHNLKLEGEESSLLFMYSPPDNQIIDEFSTMLSNIKKYNIEDKIYFPPHPIKHFERDSVLKKTHALICIGRDTIENYTCHRLRLRDVFLYEKPIIIDDFGATAELVRKLNIGITINNKEELLKAMIKLKRDSEFYNSLVDNIRKVREHFIINHHTLKLVNYIKSQQRAPDINSEVRKNNIEEILKKFPILKEQPTYPF